MVTVSGLGAEIYTYGFTDPPIKVGTRTATWETGTE